HGSVSLWRGNLLTGDEAMQLRNSEKLTFFVLMTCLNGYFTDPQLDSLSEDLLKARGGAVAVWASTALTYPDGQSLMNQALYRELFTHPEVRLGDAARRAKATAFEMDVRLTWILFADPTMRLR
ncbi:MAG TPA: C25 family cysteine peptidase, partial [Blastocatellia bacterium]|nr:C25 family cysteine peptidase [Blastocatellia bacterium]